MKKSNKNKLVFKNLESLQPVVDIVNEISIALNDVDRTIASSHISEALFGVLGAGVGGTASFAALIGLGTVGLSASGITSALGVAGAVVGGGMAAGIYVLAAPVTILGAAGVGVAKVLKKKELKQEKERLLQIALEKKNELEEAQLKEQGSIRERIDYLHSLDILLTKAIESLQKDLEII